METGREGYRKQVEAETGRNRSRRQVKVETEDMDSRYNVSNFTSWALSNRIFSVLKVFISATVINSPDLSPPERTTPQKTDHMTTRLST